MKPDLSKFATFEGYCRALANYWQDSFYAERSMFQEAVQRLAEMQEVYCDDDNGQWCWTATGEPMGGGDGH